MKSYSMFLLAAVIAVSGVAQAAGSSEVTVEYSADSSMETAEFSMKSRINYTPTRERSEMVIDGGDKMITIKCQDKKVTWMLMPAEEMYTEMSLAKAAAEDKTDISKFKIEQSVVGPDTVNGVKTTKMKIVMTGSKGDKMGGFMWMTKEKIMIKMDAIAIDKNVKMRIKSELTNLKIGKQDAALFEIPKGYSKMGMPSMGSLMGDDDEDGDAKKSAGGEKKKKRSGFMDALELLK